MEVKRYFKEDLPPSYDHSYHAGNVGDVWKHVILVGLMEELTRKQEPLSVLDCHAGAGSYSLDPIGEWTEGIGRLISLDPASTQGPLCKYLKEAPPAGPDGRRSYPGSPRLISTMLREHDRLTCCEIQPQTAERLREALAGRRGVEIVNGDGLAALKKRAEDYAEGEGETFFALIDPPWTAKQDWISIPAALIEAWRKCPQLQFLLWYPIKSYTRVSAMQKRLHEAGLSFTNIDLITMPLEERRKRLNGSGVLLARASEELIGGILKNAAVIGAACAVRKGKWEVRCKVW